MTKLPVLYISCDTEALKSPRGQSSLRRLIRGTEVCSVVFITLSVGLDAPEIHGPTGRNHVGGQLWSLLSAEDFSPVERAGGTGDLEVLATTLVSPAPVEVAELRLSVGMPGDYYRRIGQCLEGFRDQGVLIICFDEITAAEVNGALHPPHDTYIRDLIKQWEDELRWARALSKSEMGKEASVRNGEPLSNPTLCMLNTAFSLGGLKAPQRVFGSALNEGRQSLAGYGWMQ
ncbi:hypothetical protein BKP64_13825 [Marinobacter salinus]|uniref:Uncharacterized protein n=1 Tax=Marinobacter salinus TaxID=1874317 RepID=A0A1D9GND9_9GAMM|nr:hypothetical protein [Marinobacter salinus]AOY89158.1 hypothetical protein BKP64_13825 [Marinobacter salinus]